MIPAVRSVRIGAMAPESIGKVRQLEASMREMPQVEIVTRHQIHGGVYARTIMLPAGAMLTGAEIKIATTLIVSGCATVYNGEEPVRLEGYCVIPASAGRKQAFLAHEDTYITMLFPTHASTVEEAENEFTNEAHLLMSRQNGGADTVLITGE